LINGSFRVYGVAGAPYGNRTRVSALRGMFPDAS
jgi:hypothetical protein